MKADTQRRPIYYNWQGVNQLGVKLQGSLAANSCKSATAILKQQGVLVLKISKKRRPMNLFKSPIKTHTVNLFINHLATLLEAGIPLLQALTITAAGESNYHMKSLIMAIKKSLESGQSLTEALHNHPLIFNQLFCLMINAGEKSGTLVNMLRQLITYNARMDNLKKKIKKALTYPSAVLTIAMLVSITLMVFIVPQLETLFASFNAPLPAPTQIVITIAHACQKYWMFMCGSIFLVYLLLSRVLYQNSARFILICDKLLLYIPLVGRFMKNTIITRFTQTLSCTLQAGMPISESLTLATNATNNAYYRQIMQQAHTDVTLGNYVHQAIKNTNLFPDAVIQMIAIGEESGTLPQMLHAIVLRYEEQITNTIDNISHLLEPIIMSILGVCIGGLVIAMYLPLFNLGRFM